MRNAKISSQNSLTQTVLLPHSATPELLQLLNSVSGLLSPVFSPQISMSENGETLIRFRIIVPTCN